MSGRIQKSDSRESRRNQIKRNRQALGILVEHRGYDAMPCSPCFQHNRVCKMDLANSKRCGECVTRGLTNCDGGDVANACEPSFFCLNCFFVGADCFAVNRCFREQKKVEREEQEAEEALEVLQTQLATALGRLSRLRKQKRFLKERGSDLIRRGMKSVEEWEAEEEALEAQELRVVEDLAAWGAPNEIDWSSFGTGFVDEGALVTNEPSGA